jgi:hypothetical protein
LQTIRFIVENFTDSMWLAIDREGGEYYTDATHLRFGISDLEEGMAEEMEKIISKIRGKLKIEVVKK